MAGTGCTWANLVDCLHTSGLNHLASIIEETYDDSTNGGKLILQYNGLVLSSKQLMNH